MNTTLEHAVTNRAGLDPADCIYVGESFDAYLDGDTVRIVSKYQSVPVSAGPEREVSDVDFA